MESMMPIRPTTQEDIAAMTPSQLGVLNEQGVTWQERWTLKNLASSPQAAMDYLKGLGYTVEPYGKGWNFTVRHPRYKDGRRRVVDPSGLNDTIMDLYDLTIDAVQGGFADYGARLGGAAVGAALGSGAGPMGIFMGGLAGQAVGAGVTGYLTEGIRQRAGEAAGIPGNIDPEQQLAVGVGSALAPGLGRAAANLGRGVIGGARYIGGQGRELLAKLAKTHDIPGVGTPADVVSYRAATMPRELMGAERALEVMRAHNNQVLQGTAERKIAQALLDDASQKGRTIDMRPIQKFMLEDATPDKATNPDLDEVREYMSLVEDVLRREANAYGWQPIIQQRVVTNSLGERQVVNVRTLDWSRVPVRLADLARQTMDDLAAYRAPVTSTARASISYASKAARLTRDQVNDAVDAAMTGFRDSEGRSFKELQGIASQKIGTAKYLQQKIGSGDPEVDTKDVVEGATSWLSGVGESAKKEPARQLLRQYDRIHGTPFADMAREVAVGNQFEGRNIAGRFVPTMPGETMRLTPTGQVAGVALATSLGTKMLASGPDPATAAVAGGIGILGAGLSTERGIVGAFRGGQAIQRGAQAVGRELGPAIPAAALATRAGTMAALQRLAREELMASEIAKRRRESDLLTAAP